MIVFDVERLGPWLCERTGGTYYPGSATAIGLERNGELVAVTMFENCNGNSVQMHVASDGSRSWLTKAYIGIVFDYVFNQLKVKKVVGLVDSSNQDALKFDLAVGFHEEARIKDAGKTGDMVVLTMSRDQCRWLNMSKGN